MAHAELDRARVLLDLLELARPLPDVLEDLARLPWDASVETVTLEPRHVLAVLATYGSGEVGSSDVECWANAVEGREDIGFEPSAEAVLKEAIFDLANPSLQGALTQESAKALRSRLLAVDTQGHGPRSATRSVLSGGSTNQLSLPGGRSILLRPLGPAQEDLKAILCRPFAAMLPAFTASDESRSEVLVMDLVSRGCVEFCAVGPKAERLHDSIDTILEKVGAITVVTTWDNDLAEGCEYFVLAAGGRPRFLLALVGDHNEVIDLLRRTAAG